MSTMTKFSKNGKPYRVKSSVVKNSIIGKMFEFKKMKKFKKMYGQIFSHVIQPVPAEDLKDSVCSSMVYFYFNDTVNQFSSLGLSNLNAETIRDALLNRKIIFVSEDTGDMWFPHNLYRGTFKPFFKPHAEKYKPIKMPKNEDAVIVKGPGVKPTRLYDEKMESVRKRIKDRISEIDKQLFTIRSFTNDLSEQLRQLESII